ncbi:NUDIX domain-containing protein [Streptomyces sp. 130]|uniref:NUDIX hydrolase n=1 Tax=Streptomyces sp. 130 TaxID=2591006 RepID=UPI00117E6698|nr:NUDIX domain-containing protein [Streptomyces sp. 130]TRV80931.1 NUDIX domain-containing protein [Streptomyces sp. 130]
MTTTSTPGERSGVTMTDEAYGALRASHALWAGTSVLITDQHGRVLVQRVGYRPTRLLPGGALDPGESPAQGAARELREELGLAVPLTRGLAVDWVSPAGRRTSPAVRFPGELLHVFDGGVWNEDRIASIRPAPGEIEGVDFVEPADLPALMAPDDARRALSALRARVNGTGPAILEDGLPLAPTLLDRVNTFTRHRAVHHLPWHEGPAAAGLPVRQSWGWLFAPDGRVLVLLDPANGAACLPGGTPEPENDRSPAATLIREALEEASARISPPVLLGNLPDPEHSAGPCTRLRMAAVLTDIGPSRPDPATGQTYLRALATPEQVIELFNWGPTGADQLTAVHHARARFALPRATRQPLTELPDATDLSTL